MKRGLFDFFFVPQIVFGGGGDSGGGSSGGSSDSGSSSNSSSSSQKKDTVPTFKNLTAAAKAGYHGAAVKIEGKKGTYKVDFDDDAYNARMKKSSDKKQKATVAKLNTNKNTSGQYTTRDFNQNPNTSTSSSASSSASSSSNADTSASAKVNKPVKKVPPLDGGKNKPNFLGYGYYNNKGVWIPPDIDMQDGGGPGISGAVFGSKGGIQADELGNKDGYVSAQEAAAAKQQGIFKYGIGRVSNAVGATPFGSGRAPTGIAGTIAGGGIIGSALGMEYKPRDQMFGEGGQTMTQEQVDAYMADVKARQEQAVADQQQLILHGSPADGGSGGSSPGLLAQVADTVAAEDTAAPIDQITIGQPIAYDPISYNPVQGGVENPQILPYPYPYAPGFGTLPVGNFQQPNLFAQLPPPVTQGIGSLRGLV